MIAGRKLISFDDHITDSERRQSVIRRHFRKQAIARQKTVADLIGWGLDETTAQSLYSEIAAGTITGVKIDE